LISPASAGHGLNIQRGGHILIWFSLVWSLEMYQQTNARLWRQGQKEVVTIHHIVTRDTVDDDVWIPEAQGHDPAESHFRCEGPPDNLSQSNGNPRNNPYFSEVDAMSIMWKYLDKRSATIAAIKDYDSMQFIINSTDDEIKRTYEKMTSIGSPKWDGMPRTHNPQAGEERLINAISEIDILKERYRQAVEYMDWFKPAWEQLSDDDRYCLETFYGDGIPTAAAQLITSPNTCMSNRRRPISGRTAHWTG
jgi:hypothetical protein